jgi:hypothetical protein
MSYQFQHSADKSLVKIKSEQLNEIIAAILAGKYSWACFLLLRCVGYNPLDYIPYRTSHRLLQQNSKSTTVKMKSEESKSDRNKISDLDYVEAIEEKRTGIKGGYLAQAFDNLSTDTPGFVAELDFEKQDRWMLNIKGLPSQNQSFLGRTKIRPSQAIVVGF